MNGLELLTNAEMAQADRLAVAAGVPSLTLMENAGRAVAAEATRMAPGGTRVVVLCGPGNNGGDGFVAARLLARDGYDVRVGLCGARNALRGDAAQMAARWGGPVADAREIDVAASDLIIDALFGAGLSRPLDGAAARLLGRIESEAAGVPVLSVDVPSGLDGTTGMAAGPVVLASRTVTFFRRKPGHLLMPGRALCGEVVLSDIGIPGSVLNEIAPPTRANAAARSNASWLARLPVPAPTGHKYSRGHAIVVSGPAHRTGAARLGARGALRAGAGLVSVASPPDAVATNAAHLTAIMLEPFDGPRGLAEVLDDPRRNVVLIGPGAGVGLATRLLVQVALEFDMAAVLDADALTSFTIDQDDDEEPVVAHLFSLIKEVPGRNIVLTPHEGEFKRVFGDLSGSKLDRARAAAQTAGAVVVLKGPDTVIAAPDGRAAINDSAPPWLATAGSGDVLAGFITGLLGQNMPAFEAACAAVWLHGECANVFGAGLVAEDLPEMLPGVLSRLLATND
jgi:NAD(P)H-hydrate epimerase